jgi:hypothetical protein
MLASQVNKQCHHLMRFTILVTDLTVAISSITLPEADIPQHPHHQTVHIPALASTRTIEVTIP